MKKLIDLLLSRFMEQKFLDAHGAYNISRFGNNKDIDRVIKERIRIIEDQIRWSAGERKTSIVIELPDTENEVNLAIKKHFGEECGYKLYTLNHPEDLQMHYLIISWDRMVENKIEGIY